MEKHEVQQGDCVESIGWQFGHFPPTLWGHPSNQSLRELRKEGHALFPGDVLAIPDLRLRRETCSTERRHRFRRRGVPAKLHVRLKTEDEFLANEAYEAEIDGKRYAGKTDKEGGLELEIHPQARGGWIRIYDKIFQIQLGALDPLETVSGQQARLKQLGWYEGPVDGRSSDDLQAAVLAFQRRRQLTESGEFDPSTLDRLRSDYGL